MDQPVETTAVVEEKSIYVNEVRDIYFASHLMLNGYKLTKIEQGEGGFQSAFYFADVPESVMTLYYDNDSHDRQLFECFKRLRSMSTHVKKSSR